MSGTVLAKTTKSRKEPARSACEVTNSTEITVEQKRPITLMMKKIWMGESTHKYFRSLQPRR